MAKHLEVEWIRVCWCGINGVWKCKAIHRSCVRQLVERGVGLTLADPGLLLHSDTVAWGDAVGEIRLFGDVNTWRVLPHCKSHAAVMVTTEWSMDSRHFLRRMLDRLKDLYGLTMRASFEEEFFLLKGNDLEGWKPVDASTYSSVDALQRSHEVLGAMGRALEAQGVRLEMLHTESGTGQFELVWSHEDALTAADFHLIAKETILAVARAHGLKATFVPKLSPNMAGSGTHTHFSLWKDKENVMSEFAAADSNARRFVAGILAHLPALLAVGAPTTNSYSRLQPGCWAGSHACWAVSNKEAPIRVCNWDGSTNRQDNVRDVEVKCCDGTANPYLWLGCIVSAGLDGILEERVLPDPVGPKNDDMSKMTRLPEDLASALAALQGDAVVCDAMGPELSACYLAIKKKEVPGSKNDLSVLLERF